MALGAVVTPGDTAAKVRGAIIGGVVVAGAGVLAYQVVVQGWHLLRWSGRSIWRDILNGNNETEEGLRFPWTR